MQPQFLPWHVTIAQQWLGARDRFAHAWLIHGLTGIGKREFAFAAAASLLCESPIQGLACGKCLACGWVARGHHPDLKRIRPEALALEEGQDTDAEEEAGRSQDDASSREIGTNTKRAPSKDIRVEQIRALEPWFNNATHRGGWRVALIYPAEALTTISGNTLLKVLEEPPPNTVFLLVADAPDRLLPTLLSRCRRLPLATPTPDICEQWLNAQGVKNASQWLAAAGSAPLLAKRQAELQGSPCPEWVIDILNAIDQQKPVDWSSLADQLAKLNPNSWLDPLQRLAIDLNLSHHQLACRYYPSMQSALSSIALRADAIQLSQLLVWLNDQKRLAGHPLNTKLFAQSVLQRLSQSCKFKVSG
jgi:DNA polymerase III subunit delta'